MSSDLFPAEPDETRIQILQATYDALREHGYADLTIERIGEQFQKTTSLIYHHYDGKNELLLDFLAYLLENAEGDFGIDDGLDPAEKLQGIIDEMFSPHDDPDSDVFRRAMVDLRAQATTDPEYETYFTEYDTFFRERLAAIIAEGVEDGTFRDVDPDAAATMLHTTIIGSMTQQATSDVDISALQGEANAYVEHRLLAER